MEEESLGGNLNDAVRVGDTVRRRAGPWTPAVHDLLRFLERKAFPAPPPMGPNSAKASSGMNGSGDQEALVQMITERVMAELAKR